MPTDIFSNQTICYRCTPVQKQNIVNYVKNNSNELTLAIGDGANDVNMILAAHVGVGVKGREGTEATRVADIAVGEYKYLSFLVLYYGREWYRKNARLVCYNFFKNWYHVASVIAYGAYSYFSAVVIFDIYNYELFNAFYAALPIVIYAIFD
jgi:phospholipid-transporting ATPase